MIKFMVALVALGLLYAMLIWQMEVAMYNIVSFLPFGLLFGLIRIDNWIAFELCEWSLGFMLIAAVCLGFKIGFNIGQNSTFRQQKTKEIEK